MDNKIVILAKEFIEEWGQNVKGNNTALKKVLYQLIVEHDVKHALNGLSILEYIHVLNALLCFVIVLSKLLKPKRNPYIAYYSLLLVQAALATQNERIIIDIVLQIRKVNYAIFEFILVHIPTPIRNKIIWINKIYNFISDAIRGTLTGIGIIIAYTIIQNLIK